ncbi:MAG: hypothetical protein NY202_03420 [Mollicutes bacterium UO1]
MQTAIKEQEDKLKMQIEDLQDKLERITNERDAQGRFLSERLDETSKQLEKPDDLLELKDFLQQLSQPLKELKEELKMENHILIKK